MSFKIQILDTIDNFPSSLKKTGGVFLDVNEAPQLSESSGALNDISKIGGSTIASISLDFSNVNNIILERWRRTYTNEKSSLKISCSIQSAYIPFDTLTVTNVDWSSRKYSVEISLSKDHWLVKAQETTFNNIDFGSYEFTGLSVNQTNNNLPTSDGLFFPLIQYNNLFELIAGIKLSDVRPWFQLKKFLETCFCSIGYSFSCPFLDTPYGQKLYWYGLSSDFGIADDLNFISKLDQATLKFVEVSDPHNLVFPFFNTLRYTGIGLFNFFGKVSLTSVIPTGQDYYFRLDIYTQKNGVFSRASDSITGTGDGSTVYVDLLLKVAEVYLNSGDDIRIEFSTNQQGNITITSSEFYNETLRVLPKSGDIIEIKKILRPDSILDLLKGVKHLLAGKIDFDELTKTVVLHVQNNADVFGTPINGFYNLTANDYSDSQIPNQQQVAINSIDEARYLRIGFAKSNDVEYKKQSPKDEKFTRIVNRGDLFAEKTKEDRNPYFEPMASKEVLGLHPFFNVPPTLGHCITSDKTSFDIGPRIGMAFNDKQKRDGTAVLFQFEGITSNYPPTVLQEIPNDITIDNSNDENLTYGKHDIDLFSIAWNSESALKQFKKAYSIRLHGDYYAYKNISFRELALFMVDGRQVPCRVEDKTYDANQKQIIISAIPIRSSYDDCFFGGGSGVPPQVQTNPNSPFISINFDENANTVNATPNNTLVTSPIATDTFEYTTDGGSNWNSYTAGTNLAAHQVITFRRKVTYSDGESDQTVVRTFNPAQGCNNVAGLNITYNASNNSASASKTQTFNSTVSTDTLTVSIDGAAYVAYVENDILNNFLTLDFKRVATFVGACSDITVLKNVTAPVDACNNSPILGVVELESCLVVPAITGNMSSAVSHVLYEIALDGINFNQWNGQAFFKTNTLKIRATILYCDACQKTCLTYECT